VKIGVTGPRHAFDRAWAERGVGELVPIVDVYGFVVAGSLITMARLGDRIGRRAGSW
jgi:hypothetical protein